MDCDERNDIKNWLDEIDEHTDRVSECVAYLKDKYGLYNMIDKSILGDKKVFCPKCGSSDLISGEINYYGCCTDMIRYDTDTSWSHDGYQCNKCKTNFSILDDYDFKQVE